MPKRIKKNLNAEEKTENEAQPQQNINHTALL